MTQINKTSNIQVDVAFENDVAPAPAPAWRVESIRTRFGRDVRIVNWYGSEDAAWSSVRRLTDGGDNVISCIKYVPEQADSQPTT